MSNKELENIGSTFAAFGGYINYEDYIFLLTVLTSKLSGKIISIASSLEYEYESVYWSI